MASSSRRSRGTAMAARARALSTGPRVNTLERASSYCGSKQWGTARGGEWCAASSSSESASPPFYRRSTDHTPKRRPNFFSRFPPATPPCAWPCRVTDGVGARAGPCPFGRGARPCLDANVSILLASKSHTAMGSGDSWSSVLFRCACQPKAREREWRPGGGVRSR